MNNGFPSVLAKYPGRELLGKRVIAKLEGEIARDVVAA